VLLCSFTQAKGSPKTGLSARHSVGSAQLEPWADQPSRGVSPPRVPARIAAGSGHATPTDRCQNVHGEGWQGRDRDAEGVTSRKADAFPTDIQTEHGTDGRHRYRVPKHRGPNIEAPGWVWQGAPLRA
jgi:hypothetical protein